MTITRWKIRPIAFGNIDSTSVSVERDVVPVQSPMWIGAMHNYFGCPSDSDWNYQVLFNLSESQSRQVYSGFMKKKKGKVLESLVKNAQPRSAIVINGQKFRHVSEFHCFLGTLDNQLYVVDLGSKNKVWINDSKVRNRQQLFDETVIKLAGLQNDSAQFKLYDTISLIHAVYVGVNNQKIRDKSFVTEMRCIDDCFNKLEIPYEPVWIRQDEATPERIRGSLEYAARLPKKSVFLFFYNAHGNTDYITTAKEEIQKAELAELLNAVKVPKIVIINACHSGGGWLFLDEQNGLYFFSSQQNQTTKGNVFPKLLAEKITQMIKENTIVDLKSVSMDNIVEDIEKMGYEMQPVRKGLKSIVF
ncbi:FHA domain-containing protein [Candidatus Woesearchaeota archaeon]|nr:FHA domain-containing protein [Candidatus Woesearchaeota archaeon]